jgi:hypothetical protein
MSGLSVLITTSYYWPEEAGSAPYLAGLAQHLHGRGHQVVVATGYPHSCLSALLRWVVSLPAAGDLLVGGRLVGGPEAEQCLEAGEGLCCGHNQTAETGAAPARRQWLRPVRLPAQTF